MATRIEHETAMLTVLILRERAAFKFSFPNLQLKVPLNLLDFLGFIKREAKFLRKGPQEKKSS
jgi:hypothetical protein